MTSAADAVDEIPWWRSGYAMVGLLSLVGMTGFVVGHLVMHVDTDGSDESAAYAALPEFTIHGAVISAQVGLWFAAVPVLVWQQRQLLARFSLRPSWRTVVAGVLGVLAVLFVPFTLNRPGEEYPLDHAEIRTNVLYVLGIPLIAAAVLVLDAVDRACAEPGWSGPRPDGVVRDVDDLALLRATAKSVLALLGVAISLVVFATGAQFNAIEACLEEGTACRAQLEAAGELVEPPSQGMLLVYGALFVVVLAVLYAPAHRSVERAANVLVERAVPMPESDVGIEGEDVARVLSARGEMRSLLGIDTDLQGSLERSIVILSPLISGVVTLFLTGRS